jgi:two-component sensor histidine kinase
LKPVSCFIILFLLLHSFAFAGDKDYIVQKRLFTYADGLPGNKVTCINQDQLGFIWIGTPYGLCRFDGQEFQLLTPKTHGLQNRPIGSIYPDGQTGLIIAYQENFSDNNISDVGMDVIDIYTLQVKSLEEYYSNSSFRAGPGTHLYAPDDKNCTGFFPAPYDYDDIRFRVTAPVMVRTADGTFIKKNRPVKKVIQFVFRDGRETVQGSEFSAQTDFNKADVFLMADGELIMSKRNAQRYLYRDSSGYVIGRNDDNGHFHFYFIGMNGEVRWLGNESGTLGNYTFRLSNNYSNNFYGIEINDRHFISLYSPERGAIRIIDSTDSEALQRATLLHLFRDRYGDYWIATTEGLLKVGISEKYFHPLYSAAQETMTGYQSARGIFSKAGFSVVSLFTHINIAYNGKTVRIPNDYNHSSLLADSVLWLGSFNLHTFDFATGNFNFRTQSISDEIWSMFPLSGDRLLLGCTKNLDIYDQASNSIQHIDHGTFPVPALVYRIFENAQKQMVCVADNGIFIVSDEGKIVDFFGKDAKPGHQLPFSGINDLHIDKEDIWWFATPQEGLFRWDRKTNTFENFGIDEGFLSVKLCRIEEDRAGKLWISTDFGLACFDKISKRARVYNTADGLQHMEFNRSSSFKDEQGNLWFGTIDGCVFFDPLQLSDRAAAVEYPFIIRSLKKFNPATNQQEDVSGEYRSHNYLELSDETRNLSLSVLLLDLQPRVHLYVYEIEGLDNKKNYSYDGQINLANLPYGTFTLVVNAQHSDGTWSSKPLRIELRVLPPFYLSWWFIISAVLFVILLVFLYFRYRIRKISKENERLEETVGERTRELRESLAEQTALLQEVHHRVKNNLQFIAAMLQMQINSMKDEKNKAVLKNTSLRINSMTLVHEMLYNKDKLEFVHIKEYLHELIAKLKELVYDQEAPVTFQLDIDDIKFNVNDSVALGMITSEVVSNSIKYAFGKTQHPIVSIRLKHNAAKGCFDYTISDNGSGINENRKGQGLGQRLIDIFSRQMEANYTIVNENGLTYSFEIPDHADKQPL